MLQVRGNLRANAHSEYFATNIREETMYELTVVIPTKNRLRFLQEAVASVPAGVEIIVVDDGSTDGTCETFKHIKNMGTGVSAARNTGVRAAQAPLVGFLDDDDVWLPGHVEAHLEAHSANPLAVATYSQGRLASPALEAFGPPRPSIMPTNVGISGVLQQVGRIVFKRSLFVPFDEGLSDGEDLDWVERMALLGPFAPIPQVTILWRQHERLTGGYAAWAKRYRQSGEVLGRSLRRSSDSRARFSRRVKRRGWAVHDAMTEAQACIKSGRKGDAARLLCRAWMVSPPHAARQAPRFLRLARQLAE